MKSPFPGMDPYLERPSLWWGFHTRLIGTISRMLIPQVRPSYWVDVEDRVYVDFEDEGRRAIGPDVFILPRPGEPRRVSPSATAASPTAVVDAPIALPIREHSLKILRHADHEVVTIIEILSPTNKRTGGAGRGVYLAKRSDVLCSSTHLVEVDLLRQGARSPVRGELPACDYVALVHRTPDRPRAEVFAMSLREPLLVLPIPLAAGDPDVALDLGEAVRVTYEEGGYDLELDYAGDADPPLAGESTTWAAEVLKKSGARPA